LRVLEYVVFHPWRAAAILVVGTLLGFVTFYAYQVNAAFAEVAAEDFDPAAARSAIQFDFDPVTARTGIEADPGEPTYDLEAEMALIEAHLADGQSTSSFNVSALGEPIPDADFESYLLVGTDASGLLADSIILALQPVDDPTPIMVSLPRDLFVWNLCKKTFTRLNSGLGGCSGVASGPELLAIMVEDYTGVTIDHLARVDFDGFSRLIDVMGGVTVCVDHPTRDAKAHLELVDAGCQVVGGTTALAWVRSRHPEQLVDGTWRSITASDFTRQEHQQDVLFQLAEKAATFSSPATLTERLAAAASSVRLDSSWTLGQAVGIAWDYRGISRDSVERFAIAVDDYLTSYGAQVLLPSEPFKAQLSTVYDFSPAG
jgi:LCP family protein required for cell wall assembly